ncbi:MAG: HigA family addiction module antidote protein [Streptococcaceae bacterium]|jgi:addiction module HigA family antidote|nr:HigA family addiction module antidote protein [Streptococcaceae bacterium]
MTETFDRTRLIKRTITTSAGDTLRDFMENNNISQKELAFRLGVSQPHISDIINRRKFMSNELAIKLEMVTGLQAEFMLRRDFSYKLAQMNHLREEIEPLERVYG